MNTKKILFALSLVTIILSGCSKTDPHWNVPTENYGTGGSGNTGNPTTRITQVIPLNPTETKLLGRWNLKSLSTIDSLYTDSSFVSFRFIEFTDRGFADRQIPICYGNYNSGMMETNLYYSPDITHVRIINGNIPNSSDSSLLKIISLTSNELSLKDSILNAQWNFIR